MKVWPYVVVLAVILRSAVGLCQEAPQRPYVAVYTPFIAKVGEPFIVKVELKPAPPTPVKVQMETGDITYSKPIFWLGRGHQLLTAKVVRTETGLVWIYARAEGYDDGWEFVDVGYRGQLKISNTDKLPYGRETTLSFQIVDSDGKPLRAESERTLQVECWDVELSSSGTSQAKNSDAKLSKSDKQGRNMLTLKMSAGATISPQIRIQPTSRIGGIVQLNTTMEVGDRPVSQASFTLVAQPVWWLPLVLAIVGGMLHAVYKISRLPGSTFWGTVGILMTSAVAGCVGYLVANFDLFGLKLDPNVLRTYPLIGFLFSYFGIEVLLSEKLSSPKPPTASTLPTPH